MKTVGTVRRIDDLGRIVLPKEIRKNLKIRDGESLEIFIEDNNIILKKFSMMSNMYEISQMLCDTMYELNNKNIIITDRDKVIAVSANLKKQYLNKEISIHLENIIKRRESFNEKQNGIQVILDEKENNNYIISSIILNGDIIGLILILSNNETDDFNKKISNFISKIISNMVTS